MRREAIKDLIKWKSRENRKPLVLRGARQVGKTWLMKEFARVAYHGKSVYVNFEDDEVLQDVFTTDFDIKRILSSIELRTGIMVDEGTLIIFDELQAARRGVMALKYFYEKAPQLHVVAAGSLLGISIHEGDSFPVGKVDFLDLYPMSFVEYLEAREQNQIVDLLKRCDTTLLPVVADKLKRYLKDYYFVGGMPEVVSNFIENEDYDEARRLQHNILTAYSADFSKHAPEEELPLINIVWNSIAAQLSKENKKFIYGMLKQGARAAKFEKAIQWLCDAGLLAKVKRVNSGEMPLAGFADFSAFKLFLHDVGLLGAMCNLQAAALVDGNELFNMYKGALTEEYVFTQLRPTNRDIYYWSAGNSSGEIDFIIEHAGRVIPIEVKAEENVKAKSLRLFVERHPGMKGIRFSMMDYREQEWMTNVPLYCCGPFIAQLGK
ncbi:MAG: ATP-binding protein [Muribaculaceae bacterium]|nr:ATP-binding protein [Muribaculaceae bacterium]